MADWYYDTSAKTLTEQNAASGTAWVFNCTVSGQNLTLSSVKTAGTASALDFRAAIEASNGGAFAITALGNSLFLSNANITSVRLPDTLTTIGTSTFQDCSSLGSVTPFLPEAVTSIGHSAFRNCTSLSGSLRIGFGGPLTFGGGASGNGWTFENSGIDELVAGPGVTSIRTYGFDLCASLTNVVFAQAGLTSIGNCAFQDCTSLRRVTPFLPDTVTYVGWSAFQNAPVEGILRLGYGGAVTWGTGSNGYTWTFEGTAISKLIAGPGIGSFGTYCFNNCASLAEADLTESTGLTSIAGAAFSNAPSLLDVWLNSYPTFGRNVFSGVPANARFHLAKGVDAWTTWLADAANAKPWSELSAAERGVYDAAWGAAARRPKARTVKNLSPFPKDSWLLRYSTDKATMVILR
jgi:hypothetical protein